MTHRSVRVATLTVSDTRKPDDDESGRVLGELLEAAGFRRVSHQLVPDEIEDIRTRVLRLVEGGEIDAIVLCGGTGIGPRDVTIEALEPLWEKRLEGFGETFRRLSFDEVGPRALLSRGLAGTRGRTLLIALPGSPAAVRLAVPRLIAPLLEHAVALLNGHTRH